MTRRNREDRLFARYRANDDPRLLAAVFDRTAPELLRVARHLGRDADRAEDLLQTTFLVAIEERHRWDEDRPLLPWLLGILANRARSWRREDRERARRHAASDAIDADRIDAGPGVPSASELAADREFERACHDAIRSLEEPYRQVLILHLEHGLLAKEIAEVTDRPAGTVRTQIVRGMERLRSALPTGTFAAGAAALPAFDPSLLAGIKAAVLTRAGLEPAAVTALVSSSTTHATTASGLAAGGLFGGTLMTKKILLAAGAAGALATLSWFGWRDGPDAAPSIPSEDDGPTAVAIAAPDAATNGATEDATPAARTTAAPTMTAAEFEALRNAPATLVVHARYADGSAAANVRLRIGESIATTDADGTVRRDELRPNQSLFVRAVHSDGATFASLRPGQTTELELLLRGDLDVDGLVTDAGGAPFAGARIETAGGGDRYVEVARSDADGRFTLRAFRQGYRLRAAHAGLQPSDAHGVRRPAPDERVQLTLKLGTTGRVVTGRVLEPATGRGVANATVALQPTSSSFPAPAHYVTTTDDGTFRTDEIATGPHFAIAHVPATDGDPQRGLVRFVVAADDTTTVDVPLAGGATVFGTVRDESGNGLRDRVVLRYRPPEVFGIPFGDVFVDCDEHGNYRATGLLAGNYAVEAGPSAAEVQTRMTLTDGQVERWDPVIATTLDWPIRVVDARGEPLAHWSVSRLNEHGFSSGGCLTDADGRGVIPDVPRSAQRVVLEAPIGKPGEDGFVREHDRFPTFEPTAFVPTADGTTIRVPDHLRPTVTLRGRVVDRDGRPIEESRVELYRGGDNRQYVEVPVSTADGSWSYGPLTPATYDVFVRVKGRAGRGLKTPALAPRAEHDFGDIVVAEPTWIELTVQPADGDDRGLDGIVVTRDRGAGKPATLRRRGASLFRTRLLNPGRHRLRIAGPSIRPTSVVVTVDEADGGGALAIVESVDRAEPTVFSIAIPPDNPSQTGWLGRLQVDALSPADPSGTRVLDESVESPMQATTAIRRGLAPGRYRATVVDWVEKRASVEFSVPRDAPVVLRPSS